MKALYSSSSEGVLTDAGWTRKLFVITLFVLAITSAMAQDQKADAMRPGTLRIKVAPGLASQLRQARMTTARVGKDRVVISGIKSLDTVHKRFSVHGLRRVFRDAGIHEEKHRRYGLDRWYEVEMDTTGSVEQAIAVFGGLEQIEKVEPIYRKHTIGSDRPGFGPRIVEVPPAVATIDNGPNDPLFPQQWHYNNTGQSGGTAGADIELLSAWKLETGKPNIVVAVVDGGIQVDHPDLAANMWINEGEIAGNDLDDDNNGYVDDVNGYGFGDNIGAFYPDAHGTHVAGTVAAVSNNGIGVSGVAGGSGNGDGVRLMSCAVFGQDASDHFPEAYVYAADMGAIITQSSWGYEYGYEQAVLDAIDYFIAEAGRDQFGDQAGPMQGGIAIFAAGNEGLDREAYPAYYKPVVAVAGTTHNDKKSWYSNYGVWVDISAPGGETDVVASQGVLSTLISDAYGFFQGTSMACPHVSGVAALLVSRFGGPGYSSETLKERLLNTTDNINPLNPSYVKKLGSGRLNARAALYVEDENAPEAVDDLSVTGITSTSLTVSWTSPLDSGDLPAAGYDLRYSLDPITPENFDSATVVHNVPPSGAQGTTESFAITGLSPSTWYYIAIRSHDFGGHVSDLSNIAYQRTYSPPVLVTLPASLSADLVTATTTTKTLTLYNTGESSLEFSFQIPPGGNIVSALPSQGTIPAGDSLGITVTLSADGLLAGTYHEDLPLTSNDPVNGSVLIEVILTITNNGVPILVTAPDSLDFGNTVLGTIGQRIISVRNAGSEDLLIDSVSSSSDFLAIGLATPITLHPFDTVSMPVLFVPPSVGSFSSTLTLYTNDPSDPAHTISVTGNGYDPYGGLVVRPSALDASVGWHGTASRTLVVRNTNAEAVNISVKAVNNGFYNTYVPATTLALRSGEEAVAEQPEATGRYARPKADMISPRFEMATEDRTSVRVLSSAPVQHAISFQYATDFESFYSGVIHEQEGWGAHDRWVISTARPARGQKSLRFIPNDPAVAYYAVSPRVAIGTEERSTFAARINLGDAMGGLLQMTPGSVSTGYVITRVQFDGQGGILALVKDGPDAGHFETLPVTAPEGYFDLAIEAVRSTSEFSLYINGEKVFTGLGFAGSIEQGSFIATGSAIVDIDDLRIIDGGHEGVPYMTVDPLTASIPAGDSVTVTVNFDAAQLGFGEYPSTVLIQQSSWADVVVPALLTVTGAPNLVAVGEVPVVQIPSGDSATARLMLRNTGGAPVDYSVQIQYAGNDTTWLSTDPTAATLPAGQYTYLQLRYYAALEPGEYTATVVITSDVATINAPVKLIVTSPAHIAIEPDTLYFEIADYDQQVDIEIHNTGESQLTYKLESNTSFRKSHFTIPTPWNTDPVGPGIQDTAAILNDAGWSFEDQRYIANFYYYYYSGNLDGQDGWAAEGVNWEVISPIEYEYYMRGRSDGSGTTSAMFSPRVVVGTERVSSVSIDMSFQYSSGTTWQLVPQSLTDHKVITRLQINPDQTLQVLVADDTGHPVFQRIRGPLPGGNFNIRIEVDRETSLFSIFFNGARAFTGKGFSNVIDQLAIVSQMEEDGASIFITGFTLEGGTSVVLIRDSDTGETLDTHILTGTIEAGETYARSLMAFPSDLVPGIYRDSLRVESNDPDKPVMFVPYTLNILRPYFPPGDYTPASGKLEVTYDTAATILPGGSATINVTVHNSYNTPQTVHFPQPVPYDHEYRAFYRGAENFRWTDISTTGTLLPLGDDDSQVIRMPFTFFVDRLLYSDLITIGSNGYLRLGDEEADSPDNLHLGSDWILIENYIAPYWDDLGMDEHSAIYYKAEGETFTVQYTNIPLYGTNLRNTFQVSLRSDGTIRFQYLEMHDQQGASIGLAGRAEKPVSISTNSPFVYDSLAIVFQYAASTIIDDETGYWTYEMYPWIDYPANEHVSIPAMGSTTIPIQLSSDTPGVLKGDIFLTSYEYYDWGQPGRNQIDNGTFVLPVSLTVLDNSPPVLDPVEAMTLPEASSVDVTFTATDPNDSLVTVSLENAPDFISLLHSENGSATYRIAPAIGKAGEYSMVVKALDPHGAMDVDTFHLSVIRFAVTSFSLINTATGEVLVDFTDQVTIDKTDPDFSLLTIRANTTPEIIGGLEFKIDGRQSNIDNTSPYQLTSRRLIDLAAGQHRIVATPFTEKNGHGKRGQLLEATVTILHDVNVVVDFSLININTGKVLLNFDNAVTIDKSRYDFTSLGIIANTAPAAVGSVKFKVDGSQRNIDNAFPYALHAQVLASLNGGEHILLAEPFTLPDGQGMGGQGREAVITIIEAATKVVDFSLVNIVTGEVLLNFDGALTLNKYRPDLADLTIRANTSPSVVGCVNFDFDLYQMNIDNTAPYLLRKQVLASLTVGDHRFFAEPFTGINGHGERGERKEAIVTITDVADAGSMRSAQLSENAASEITVDLYPMPVSDAFTLSMRNHVEGMYQLSMINSLGQVVYTQQVSGETLKYFELSTNAIGVGNGVYYLHIAGGNSMRMVKKIVKQ